MVSIAMSCRWSSTLPRRFGRRVIKGFQWLSAFCFAFEIPPCSFGPKGSTTHCNTSPSSAFWFCLSACCSETSNIWSSCSVLPPRWGIPFLSHAASLQAASEAMTPWPSDRAQRDPTCPVGSGPWDRGTKNSSRSVLLDAGQLSSSQLCEKWHQTVAEKPRLFGNSGDQNLSYDISRESWQWTKQAPESDRICLQRSSQVPHSKIHGSSQVVHVVPANTKLNDPNSSNPKECSHQSDRSFWVSLRICGRKGHNSRSRIHFISFHWGLSTKSTEKKYQRWFIISFPLPSGHLTYSLAMEKWPTSNWWNLATDADGPMWSVHQDLLRIL